MDLTDVSLALLSAVLHAGWNAAVKTSRNPAQVMTAQMVLGAVLVVPALFFTGLPDLASFGWIAASTVMNLLTVSALLLFCPGLEGHVADEIVVGAWKFDPNRRSLGYWVSDVGALDPGFAETGPWIEYRELQPRQWARLPARPSAGK